jgi:hypothetical protein
MSLLGQAVTATQEIGDSVARERLSPSIEEDEAFRFAAVLLLELAQENGCLFPQGANAVAVPFAVQADLSRAVGGQVSPSQLQRFVHPGAGVVEEQQQRGSPQPTRRARGRRIEHPTELLGLEVAWGSLGVAFGGQREDAHVLFGGAGIVAQEVLNPRAQRGQATVPGHGPVAALVFQMDQEVQDALDGYVSELQPVNATMGLAGQELEEQA